ncbi:hypothetical protein GUITHDRAFT_135286 [Guillardia theta CCMP2712]|uniref:Armadillo repeat-containing domain-containing protein n=1 Tax=Guillardia theta (strain CCMP2712) TaxID=905079 RepID=L1JR52_GUITC|nr:hypothetical protein GUITHDRAFT_135286 [Guillardia theta CCMP2712]EKX50670.1 hypothetical protein GUITHDRAFT_135286 [Guillardia theta CCMP2712]|eukprot:XP_005837650.1 hypothetical protein GUITHDRAFT_135286 [Guillardia theta CCMP2712]
MEDSTAESSTCMSPVASKTQLDWSECPTKKKSAKKQKCGRKSKKSDELIQYKLSLIEASNNPGQHGFTLMMIAEEIEEGYAVNCSPSQIKAVISCIKHVMKDTCALACGAMILQVAIEEDVANLDIVREEGAIDLMVECMKFHAGDADVQSSCCIALASYIELAIGDYLAPVPYQPKSAARARQAGGAEAVVTAMKRFPKKRELQECACAALRSIGGDQEAGVERVRNAGGIEVAIAALRNHGKNLKVAEQAFSLLFSLWGEGEMQTCRMFGEAGAIEAIMDTMLMHKMRGELQLKGSILLTVASSTLQNCARLQKHGGVEFVMLTMRNHHDMWALQEVSCKTFANLALLGMPTQDAIRTVGGIDAIESAMKTYGKVARVQEEGCRALHCLANSNPVNTDRILELDGIPKIIGTMKVHRKNVTVQMHGIKALNVLIGVNKASQLLASEADSIKERVRPEGIKAVITAMRLHKEEADFQRKGSVALESMARGNEENRKKIDGLLADA